MLAHLGTGTSGQLPVPPYCTVALEAVKIGRIHNLAYRATFGGDYIASLAADGVTYPPGVRRSDWTAGFEPPTQADEKPMPTRTHLVFVGS